MLNTILASFYERDLRRLIDEINAFQNEENLWKTAGAVANSSGNLALHLIGGLNYLIGTNLAHTGYIRNRDLEFTQKGVQKAALIAGIEQLIPIITKTLNALTPEQMQSEYPIMFDDAKNSNSYVLVQLLAHLNYHLGQVNYLRRILE
ncbi:MAG: DUF1572 family protein [Bacteroidetes bacterium]|nr:DUF1572 family protein [Bacteroidota bacterium]